MGKSFSKKDKEVISRPDGKLYNCFDCGLYKNCKSPQMKPHGNFKMKILNIGEAPGEIEDAKGMQWQGKTGQLLNRTYKTVGIDLFEDCLNINSINCRPTDKNGKNRTPTNREIECCRRKVLKVIREYKPRIIGLFGNSAIYSLMGHRWKLNLGGISKWQGWTIPDQDFQSWIVPTYHPSFIERYETGEALTIWKNDLQKIYDHHNRLLMFHNEPVIEYIEDLSVLNKITSGNIAIDYETTGLKPHADGHNIICVSIADSSDHCYTFMLPKLRRDQRPLLNLLANPMVGKFAHNMKFEETWSEVCLNQPVSNWVWDSMLAAHILDNRQGISGLKFQVYVQFGVVDYSSELDPFLKPNNALLSANSKNKIEELIATESGKNKLLKYNALDALYEFKLASMQREIILKTLTK